MKTRLAASLGRARAASRGVLRCSRGALPALARGSRLKGLLLALLFPVAAMAQVAPTYKSPLGLAVDHGGNFAYVALHTANSVAIVDLRAGEVVREIGVGKAPWDVAFDGGRLLVTCEDDDTMVQVNLDRLAVTKTWKVGQAPRGLAMFPDGSRAFIACHDERTLQAVNLESGGIEEIGLPGWPERVVFHRDSMYPCVLVLSSNPGEAHVTLIGVEGRPRILASSRLAGVSNARGLASKQGTSSFVVVVHQNPRDKVPVTQVPQGWVFTNSITSLSPWGVDTPRGGTSPPRVLDNPRQNFADPSDVVLSPDQKHAFVACAGADEILVLRTDKFVSANYGPLVATGEKRSSLPAMKDDLALSRHYVRGSVPTQANPRRLALSGDGSVLVVSNHLADSLTVLDAQKMTVVRHISLGRSESDAVRRGARLFYTGKLTMQGQFSCASCHPGGGSDGLSWDLARDGLGNFLNTRALLGIKDTVPFGWLASSPTLEDRVAGTLRTTHDHDPRTGEVADLAAYIRSLPAPRPLPQMKADRSAAARGKVVFEVKGRCASCHRRDALDESTPHDVGTRGDGDQQDRFDTPSLRGVARSAPYLHHGGAKTLAEIFSHFNPQQRHGAAHLLTAAEMQELLAYLQSL